MQRTIPEGYERVEHHDLTLHDEDRGIIIMLHERDEIEHTLLDKYPYKVSAAQNQEERYTGTFQSRSHAENKVFELAERL